MYILLFDICFYMPGFFLHACECSCIPVMSSVVNDVISSCSQERKAAIYEEELVSSILVNNVTMTVIELFNFCVHMHVLEHLQCVKACW